MKRREIELAGSGPGAREKTDAVANTDNHTNGRRGSVMRAFERRRGETGSAVDVVGKGGHGGAGVVDGVQGSELKAEDKVGRGGVGLGFDGEREAGGHHHGV